MKRSLTLVFACAAAVLLVTASAAAAEYNTFVSCDEPAENPSPSYFCEVGEAPRAFFELVKKRPTNSAWNSRTKKRIAENRRSSNRGFATWMR